MSFPSWQDAKNIKLSEQAQNGDSGTNESQISIMVTLPTGSDPPETGGAWSALSDVRISGDEKNFIRGFVAALQLTQAQEHELLLQYLKQYQKAFKREHNPNRQRNSGLYAANTWLRLGADGFVDRSPMNAE